MNKTGVAMSYRAAHLDTDRPGTWPLFTVVYRCFYHHVQECVLEKDLWNIGLLL
jgi:hypothetical protein